MDQGKEIGSSNLWDAEKLEGDENKQIEVPNPNSFLSRGTSDRRRVGLDASLAHYSSFIDKEIFVVFHNKYFDDASIPILALKALSRYTAYSSIPNNVTRIMLIDKIAAIRIFGYGPSFWPSRAGYFLCYSAYALGHGMKSVESLQGYTRKKFLRYRGEMPQDEDSSVKKLKSDLL